MFPQYHIHGMLLLQLSRHDRLRNPIASSLLMCIYIYCSEIHRAFFTHCGVIRNKTRPLMNDRIACVVM